MWNVATLGGTNHLLRGWIERLPQPGWGFGLILIDPVIMVTDRHMPKITDNVRR